MNSRALSLLVCMMFILLFSGCEDRQTPISSQTATSDTESTSTKDASLTTDSLLGKWLGPEGTFLELAGGDGKYTVTIQNLDGSRTFQGHAIRNQIEFERDGVKESLHASNGAETGMKWLSEKTNCITVLVGEGYCKD